MSIVNMKKLAVIGLDTEKQNLMSQLMNLGTVEITKKEKADEADIFEQGGTEIKDNPALTELEYQIGDIALALKTLEKYSPEKQPLFFTRRRVFTDNFNRTIRKKDAIMGNVRGILQLRSDMHRLNEERNRLLTELNSVRPWKEYGLPLNLSQTEYTDIDIGTVPSKVDFNQLKARIEEETPDFLVDEITRDKDFIYLVTISMKDVTENVVQVLRKSGYSQAVFKGFAGTAKENEEAILEEISQKERKIREVERKITGRYGEKKEIECLYDQLVIDRDKEEMKMRLQDTRRTFSFEGWVPEPALDKVKKLLDDNICYYAVKDPEEDENVPVLMNNRSTVVPFESITEMYSLPDYHGVDPTRFFAAFYALFFGMMLSDAGYGIVISVVTWVFLKKYDLEGMNYKMIKMFFYCGLSTIFWGAMFGGWFGNFIEVAAKVMFNKDVTVQPIWFNPIDDPTRLLIFSLAIGIVHLFVALAIKAGMLIKRGHPLDAVFDVFSWYAVIAGAVMWVVGAKEGSGLSTAGKFIFLGGLAVLLFTGGRKKKGFGKVIGGLGAVYNITGYASDILSYSRILALGLATGVIAQVVNTIGSLSGPGVKGTIILLIVFVIGHVFNLLINALGAFVHASRLQYIEFFGKFYEDGGEAFNPFRRNTKYVKLTDNSMEVEK